MRRRGRFIFTLCLAVLLALAGCGGAAPAADVPVQSRDPVQAGTAAPSEKTDVPLGKRPSEPVIYEPEAPGTAVLGGEPLVVDVSNADKGYMMARYSGDAAKAVIQLTGADGITYKYFLPPSQDYIPLPLTGGSGAYTVDGYENVTDNKYAVLFKETADVQLESEFLPYLYPNQYVLFDSGTQAVAVAAQEAAGAEDDLAAVEKIYHYVVDNVVYDDEKAATVAAGYLPTVDETLRTGKGICFDYAALTTAMLRSQDIPTRLEIGYSGDVYHSWISVYIEDVGWIDKLIEFTGSDWTRMDPTFASNGKSSKAILQYIGDGSNYTVQYLH